MDEVLTPRLGTFIVTCACATLGMMVSLCFIIFHMYHRNNRVVKMTSPYLNLLISFGAILLSFSCFMFGLDFIVEGNLAGLSSLCQARAWMINLATSIVFGPVVAKTWRIYQIFKYGAVKRVVIKDSRLITISVCIVIIDIIIMCLWQIIDPMMMHHTHYLVETVRPVDLSMPTNKSAVVQECVCQRLLLWISLLALWKLIIFSQALVLAWKIRNVTVPTLNDSSSILAAIFGAVLLSYIGMLMSSALQRTPNAVYILTTILMSGCSMWIQIVLFLPKIHYWWKHSSEFTQSIRISSTSVKDIGTGNEADGQLTADINGNSFEEDGIVELVEENKQLKQSLLEKQEFIGTLQKHLDIAKEKISSLPADAEKKIDDGFEFDIASKDIDWNESNVYDTLRSPERTERVDRSNLYRVDGISNIGDTDFESIDEYEDHSRHETVLKQCPSIRSWNSRRSFVEEFTDIRNTLAAELSSAQAINIELKESCDKDFKRPYSETEWLYERKDADDLANSITQSYDLENNREIRSYINTYIPRENSVYQVRSRTRSSSVISVNSSETYSQTSVEIESSDVQSDAPSVNRQNSTPNSQQHAAILRYYSYRHMNDKFNRYMMGRYASASRDTYCPKIMLNNEVRINGVPSLKDKGSNKLRNLTVPSDSFV